MNQTKLFGSALVVIFSGLWYIGIFNEVKFRDAAIGPAKFFYKRYEGEYEHSGSDFEALLIYLKEKDLEDFRIAGIFYDNPKPKKKKKRNYNDRFRVDNRKTPKYLAGFLVETGQQEDRGIAFQEAFLKDFEVMDIKETKTIMSSFPIRAGPLSYGISAMKTYPAFHQKGYNVKSGAMEIYDSAKIDTHFPQDNFNLFLPGCLEDEICT